ncbi:hypothetical protein JB92DRAFT_3060018 [Gautieria morchelliformis]|nr:hypothetical protein JB92DRAFT_3060018 [Gautieria morchelliformis]
MEISFIGMVTIYHPTGIRALALSPVPSNPRTVCTGLESGNIQRFEAACALDELVPGGVARARQAPAFAAALSDTGRKYNGRLVWDLFLPPGASIPANMSDRDAMLLNKKMGPSSFRTLHTPFPVLVVSNNESERDTVEIWDIRRAWIGRHDRYAVKIFSRVRVQTYQGRHRLCRLAQNPWAQHVNGTFAQHDLRESFRPLDAIPRVAMSWTAYGSLAFGANN